MSNEVNIKIDGKEIKAKKGDNLLSVAKRNGINIPSLCYLEKLSPTGACRMCITKIEGVKGHITACTTEIDKDMVVTAFDDELENERKEILDLLLSEHNEEYDESYYDEFKNLVERYGLDKPENRKFPSVWKELGYPIDDSSPVLTYDATKCIKCFRCIKACDEIQGKNVLSFTNRGITSYIVAGFGVWKDSECDGCGECIQLCPTGAIVEKALIDKVNLNNIERKVRTTCAYCGVGCQIDLWIQNNKIVRVTGSDMTPNRGSLCIKGRFGYEYIHSPDRLTKPLVRKNGELVETSMNEALDLIANKFKEILDNYGASAFGAYTSAKCTNEENYLFQKFFRGVIGTNSVEHCARLCHSSTVTALKKAIGSGAMGNSIEEFENCECIFVIGSNPIETHPVSATYLKKGARNGAKIIVADPKKTPLVKYSTMWLKQKGGTDVPLINAIVNVIIKEKLYDEDFIKNRVDGGMETFEDFKKHIEEYTPEKAEQITGVPKQDIIRAAKIFGSAKTASVVTGMGMSQSSHGTDNVLSLINMALITGNYGRESTGVNPLRGQNNVQGASDMGGINNVYSGYQSVTDEEIRKKFSKAWNVPIDRLSNEIGLTSVEMVHEADKGNLKAMYIMGENPMLTDPNLNHAEESFKKLDFLVVQDIFMTEIGKLADVVLPASAFAEKNGTFTNTDRRVLRVRKALESPGEAMEDWKYIVEISNRMGYKMDYKNASEIMDEIASVTPSYAGIDYNRIENEPLQWPCTDKNHPGTKFLHKESFPIGKGRLIKTIYNSEKDEQPDEEFPFILNTGRTLYHYHTGSMSRRTKPLNFYIPKSYMEINPVDVKRLNLKDGEKVKVVSRRGEIEVYIKVSENVGQYELFLPFHFSESPANILTDDTLDPMSKIPRYKQSACRIEKL